MHNTDYNLCLMTPNLNEFRRLACTIGGHSHTSHSDRIKKMQPVRVQERVCVCVCDTVAERVGLDQLHMPCLELLVQCS